MPVLKHIQRDDLEVIVWKIEESNSFFSQDLNLNKEESEEFMLIQAENRKLEWLAARFVQRTLIQDSLVKDEYGKPRLKTQQGFISLTHCSGYAAASYSRHTPTGIDIELVHPRILRIANKFTSDNEWTFVSKSDEVAHLICLWCLKESVYKWYGKKNLSFKNNIQVNTFQMNEEQAHVDFIFEEFNSKLNASFFRLDDLVVAYL